MWSVKDLIPAVGFAVHMLEVGIVGIIRLKPRASFNTALEKSVGRIEHILVVVASLHEHAVICGVAELFGNLCHSIVVVSILDSFGYSTLLFVPERTVGSILIGHISVSQIFFHPRAAAIAGYHGALQCQCIGTAKVEIIDAAFPAAYNECWRMVAVEIGRNIAVAFLASVDCRLYHIARHSRGEA